MYGLKELLSSLFLIVAFSACGSTTTVQPQVDSYVNTEPKWYLHPPQSDLYTLYGVGEGANKNDAVAHALADILARLNVSVSSSFSSKSVVHKGIREDVQKEYIDNVTSEVQKINISSYELLQSQKLGFKRYAALVKVNKRDFAEALKKELERDFFALKEIKNDNGLNALQQLYKYKNNLQKLRNIENKLAVLNMLDKDFNQDFYLKKYEEAQKEYDVLKRSISFWVYADYTPLAEPIKKGLSKEKFYITKGRGNRHFDVYISTDITTAHAYGFYIVRANITVQTKSHKKSVVAVNNFMLKGHSSESFTIAKQALVKALSKKIDQEGIYKLLNLDI